MSSPAEAAPFDPYQQAWRVFDAEGLEGLDRIEAPMAVLQPDRAIAAAAAGNLGLRPDDLRWMILPDARPVISDWQTEPPVGAPEVKRGHLNVVGSRPVHYRETTEAERRVISGLANIVDKHIIDTLQPKHGTMVTVFGKVPTTHVHVVPRFEWTDGLDWTKERLPIGVAARHAVKRAVAFTGKTFGQMHDYLNDTLAQYK